MVLDSPSAPTVASSSVGSGESKALPVPTGFSISLIYL